MDMVTAAHIPVTSATAASAPVAPPVNSNQVNLFLHLDKSIYQPQETIWFTGYVLNRDADLMSHQNTLYVVLIDPVKRTPVLKQRFQIKNGLGKGFLSLPDSIVAGDYWFVGYTNALLETGEQPLFRKLITIRSAAAPFKVSYKGIEESGDSILVRYKVGTGHNGSAAGGNFTYTIFDSTNAISSGQKLVDSSGDVVIPVGAEQDFGKYREIATTITLNGSSKELILPVFTRRRNSATSRERNLLSAPTVTITPDTAQYHQRSKVTLRIHISDSTGQPLPGLFSIAVASSAKMRPDSSTSITSYDVTDNELPLPESLKRMASEMPDSGYVLQDENKVKRPVTLALMGNGFASFQTDSTGRFALPYSALIAPVGGVNYISVADKSPERYKIIVNSLSDQFERHLATVHFPVPRGSRIATPEADDAATDPSPDMLKAAVVTARIENEFIAEYGEYSSKHCDRDFVCLEHREGNPGDPHWQLNCPENHAHNASQITKPVEGQRYYYTPKRHPCGLSCGVAFVTYHCAAPSFPPFIKTLEPILGEKSFPVPYNKEKEMLGSGLQSTIYWQYKLVTDANGDATVTFYTNDLTGKFTCLLQGVSQAGVIQGAASYLVAE